MLEEEEDRISDIGDIATREEQRETEYAIQRARQQPTPPKDWDREACYECGNELPIERITANRFLCVSCKELEEKRMKGY